MCYSTGIISTHTSSSRHKKLKRRYLDVVTTFKRFFIVFFCWLGDNFHNWSGCVWCVSVSGLNPKGSKPESFPRQRQ